MLITSKILQRALGLGAGPECKLSLRTLRSGRNNKVTIGSNSILHCLFSFDKSDAEIEIGDRCYIGRSHLVAARKISIGSDVIISWGVTIVDHNSHSVDWKLRKDDIMNWHGGRKEWKDVAVSPVVIEDRVWIGFNAMVLKGVNLGEGSVVGAGSLVTKDVPPYAVVAGNPARVIRQMGSSDA